VTHSLSEQVMAQDTVWTKRKSLIAKWLILRDEITRVYRYYV
jgi:hypothetical protein